MPTSKNNNAGRDLISGDLKDNNRNTAIGSGIVQRDDSRDINQFFGTNPVPTGKEDLAELLSMALFGNDRLDFKGVVSEVSALKTAISNLIQQIESLQHSSKIRDQSMAEMKNYILQLEKDILSLKRKTVKWIDIIIYCLIAVGTISSIISLIITVSN